MNRPPMFIFEKVSGVWHRPDRRQLASTRGLGALCRERIAVAAVAFEDCRPVELRCYECDERHAGTWNAE